MVRIKKYIPMSVISIIFLAVWIFGSQDRTFTFTVDNVIKDGMNYDPDLNNETSDTVEYP